jgi:K+-sensing histidine kinase KdpD
MDTTFDEINKAVADIDRVIGIFNALLRLAEIDSGVRRAGFRRVELATLVTEVAELYGPLAEEKQAAFDVDTADAVVNGDPYLLAQAVGNLVDNAVKYTPAHGRLSLRIGPANDGQVEIAVADNGPGIADCEKPRVTQRFYRSETGNGKAGIGLGLSVVDAVARLHDGALTLADNNPGVIASLRLPAAPLRCSAVPAKDGCAVFPTVAIADSASLSRYEIVHRRRDAALAVRHPGQLKRHLDRREGAEDHRFVQIAHMPDAKYAAAQSVEPAAQ